MATLIDSSVLIAAERGDLDLEKAIARLQGAHGTSTSPLPVIAVVKLEGFIYSDLESMNM
jgi:hypothetical protein